MGVKHDENNLSQFLLQFFMAKDVPGSGPPPLEWSPGAEGKMHPTVVALYRSISGGTFEPIIVSSPSGEVRQVEPLGEIFLLATAGEVEVEALITMLIDKILEKFGATVGKPNEIALEMLNAMFRQRISVPVGFEIYMQEFLDAFGLRGNVASRQAAVAEAAPVLGQVERIANANAIEQGIDSRSADGYVRIMVQPEGETKPVIRIYHTFTALIAAGNAAISGPCVLDQKTYTTLFYKFIQVFKAATGEGWEAFARAAMADVVKENVKDPATAEQLLNNSLLAPDSAEEPAATIYSGLPAPGPVPHVPDGGPLGTSEAPTVALEVGELVTSIFEKPSTQADGSEGRAALFEQPAVSQEFDPQLVMAELSRFDFGRISKFISEHRRSLILAVGGAVALTGLVTGLYLSTRGSSGEGERDRAAALSPVSQDSGVDDGGMDGGD